MEAVADYKYFKAYLLFGKAETVSGDEKVAMISETLKNYQDASNFAKENLNPSHPARLSIEFNLSEVYKHLLNKEDKALAIAKDAYDKGSSCLSELDKSLSSVAEDRLKKLKGRIDLWS